MTDETTETTGTEDGQQAALETPDDNRTDYMILYAPEPEDDDHKPRWRTAGYVRAHDGEQALRMVKAQCDAVDHDGPTPAASVVVPNEHARAILDAAEARGVRRRAVPQRSWPEETTLERVKTQRSWV